MDAIAGGMLKSAAKQQIASIAGKAQGRIAWEDFNYPCRREPFNIVHFDLEELKKVNERAHHDVRRVYWWFLLTLFCVLLNFVDCIILASGIGDKTIYNGINVLYSVFNIIIGAVGSMFAVYNAYKGMAEPSPSAKRYAMIVMLVLILLEFLQAFLGSGNTNGLANLASDRMKAASGMGIYGFWVAITILESVLFIAAGCLGGYGLFLTYKH